MAAGSKMGHPRHEFEDEDDDENEARDQPRTAKLRTANREPLRPDRRIRAKSDCFCVARPLLTVKLILPWTGFWPAGHRYMERETGVQSIPSTSGNAGKDHRRPPLGFLARCLTLLLVGDPIDSKANHFVRIRKTELFFDVRSMCLDGFDAEIDLFRDGTSAMSAP
jgi:hypothetical protein